MWSPAYCMVLLLFLMCCKSPDIKASISHVDPCYALANGLTQHAETVLKYRHADSAAKLFSKGSELITEVCSYPLYYHEDLVNLQVRYYHGMALLHKIRGQYEIAETWIDSSLQYHEHFNSQLLGEHHYYRALIKLNQTLEGGVYRELRKAASAFEDNHWQQLAEVYLSAGTYFTYKNKIEDALRYFSLGEQIIREHNGNNFILSGKIYVARGKVYRYMARYSRATEMFEKASAKISKNSHDPEAEYLYASKRIEYSKVLTDIGRKKEAVSILNELAAFIDRASYNLNYLKVSYYRALAYAYHEKQKYGKAIEARETAVEKGNKYSQVPDYEMVQIKTNNLYDYIWFSNEEVVDSLYTHISVAYSEILEANPFKKVGLFNNMGTEHVQRRNLETAYEYYKQSKNILENLSESDRFMYDNYVTYSSVVYDFFASYYLYKDYDLTSSMNYAHEGLKINNPVFDENVPTKVPEHPDPVNVSAYLNTLKIKGRIFENAYLWNKHDVYLKSAFRHYFHGVETIEISRTNHLFDEDKLNYPSGNHELYRGAVKTAWEIFENTGDDHYVDKALQVIERSKNDLLTEKVLLNVSIEDAGLPKDLRKRETKLRNVIREKELRKRNLESRGKDEQAESLEREISVIQKSYHILLDSLKHNNQEYYEQRKPMEDFASEDFRQKLQNTFPNKTLLTYFYNNYEVYIFGISSEEVFFKRQMANLPLDTLLYKMEEAIHYNEPDAYAALANNLYNILIKPVENYLGDELMIVPYRGLNFINFEMLVSDYDEESVSGFNDLTYAIEDYQITTGYSLKMFFELPERQKAEPMSQGVLAVAPWTGDKPEDYLVLRNGNYHTLYYSGKETRAISNLFPTLILSGEQATRKRFLEHAPEYDVLHLATHGEVNRSDPHKSRLYLAPALEGDDPDFIEIGELYNMRLKASLVSLGACETGLGNEIEGEGIMNFVRGFAYAGAPNIVYSHWEIPDQSTSVIMEAFYANLSEGMDKDAALRNAKLQFLENADRNTAAPYFWAGTSFIGNPSALVFENNRNLFLHYLIYAVPLLLLLLTYLLKRRLSKHYA